MRSPCHIPISKHQSTIRSILEYDIKRVDNAWNVAENSQQDVDQQVNGTARLHKDTQGL